MSPDEARKLLGGYATGSLTDAERTALLHAALEDQDLFDQLAGEQVLKEVLDQPGARQRLLAALEPPRHRSWVWGWAGAAATLAVVIGVVVSQRTQPPEPQQEIAQVQVLKAPEQMMKAPAPAPAVAPAPPPPPPAELRKERLEKLADQQQQAQSQDRGFVAAAPPPAAAAPPAVAAMRAENAAKASGFSFDYTVRDGLLEIVPAASGFLSVMANGGVLFPGGTVSAGTPVRVSIPSDATSLVIGFSRTQGIAGSPVRRDGASGTVTDRDPPNGRILIELFLTPATR